MDMEFVKATSILLGINLIYAVIALVIGVLAVMFVDRVILTKVDLEEEIQKGNIAAAIFGGVLLLFVAIIIAAAFGR